jgi:hypothetical protein
MSMKIIDILLLARLCTKMEGYIVAVQWGLLAHKTSARRGIGPVECVCTQKGKRERKTVVDWESPSRRICGGKRNDDVCGYISGE